MAALRTLLTHSHFVSLSLPASTTSQANSRTTSGISGRAGRSSKQAWARGEFFSFFPFSFSFPSSKQFFRVIWKRKKKEKSPRALTSCGWCKIIHIERGGVWIAPFLKGTGAGMMGRCVYSINGMALVKSDGRQMMGLVCVAYAVTTSSHAHTLSRPLRDKLPKTRSLTPFFTNLAGWLELMRGTPSVPIQNV